MTPHLPSLETSSLDQLPCGLSFRHGPSHLPVRGSGTHCPGHGAPWKEDDPAWGWRLMRGTILVPASHSGLSTLQPVLCANIYDAPLCVCVRAQGPWVHLPDVLRLLWDRAGRRRETPVRRWEAQILIVSGRILDFGFWSSAGSLGTAAPPVPSPAPSPPLVPVDPGVALPALFSTHILIHHLFIKHVDSATDRQL